MDYAIAQAVPAHLAEVKDRTLDRLARVEGAVRERLGAEINYWDHRAAVLKDKELAGKGAKGGLNSGIARQRAEELAERLKRRLAEIDEERQLSAQPPVVVGGALVVPAGLLAQLRGQTDGGTPEDTSVTERIAVDAVMAAERELGYLPEEQDHFNPGFDIFSRDPLGGAARIIEVKGRVAGASTVTITRNELLHALNAAETHILALVDVSGEEASRVTYVRGFPYEEPGFGVTSVNHSISALLKHGGEPS